MRPLFLCLPLLLAGATFASGAAPLPHPAAHRVFATSRFSIDQTLARPYDADVPFGSAGDRVWATSPQGWGFGTGVHLLYFTNLNAFDVEVRSGQALYGVGKAQYYPSHVEMTGAPMVPMVASASFTYITDNVQNPLTKPFRPEKRWTCWSSGRREDWFRVDLGRSRAMSGLDLYFFDDQPVGGCAPPESVTVELYRGGDWHSVALEPFQPKPGKNVLRFAERQPQRGEQLRLTFHHSGRDRYTGLYGFDPHFTDSSSLPPARLRVRGDKWITSDDFLVTQLTVTNPSAQPQPVSVKVTSALKEANDELADRREVAGFPLYLRAAASDGKTAGLRFTAALKPGETRTYRIACSVADTPEGAETKLGRLLRGPDPLKPQVASYQGWYDRNIAYFDCSDPLVRKMYYHRWYNLRKNSMNPRLGRMQHRTFAEGRWTADWYANVISYGAGHQIREARWLRDPSYAWGHLLTWTDNPKPDGVFPSHVTPKGPQGGQYTDWITSTAWDTYLVHPDRPTLSGVADTLARNAEGWRKVYGWDGSPLLVVDSHWWTGMEWQPAFFSFAGYHTEKKGDEVPLRRVDLSAYNYGNALNTMRVFRELGRLDDARRMENLANETRSAMLKQMWDPETRWFHDLRYPDGAKSPDKEIIGLYPFYFDLPPRGQGYEAAWKTALSPQYFWTRWPLASVSKDCPAYAQNGWPIGPGGSGCMWNGPTWPHANSLVLTGMANTLRHYDRCALTKMKLLELFQSFTRAQYRDGDPRYPWTGEYYNGDTGQWKTAQRDYNHSTWIDPLVHDLLGLVARPDDVLEIDPLLPAGAWSRFLLDGQAYRGHDVTIGYDREGGHYAPGFKGFVVYLDGKQIFHAAEPTHFRYDMLSKKLIKG